MRWRGFEGKVSGGVLRVALLVCVLAVAATAAASATAATSLAGLRLGGGTLHGPYLSSGQLPTPSVSLGVSRSGLRVAAYVKAPARCAGQTHVFEGFVVTGIPVRSDGRFHGYSHGHTRPGRVVRLSIGGRIRRTGSSSVTAAASGVLRVSVRDSAGAHPLSCRSSAYRWQARAVTLRSRPAALPRAGSEYFGITRQPGRYAPHPVELKVTRTGRAVTAMSFEIREACGHAGGHLYSNLAPTMRIGTRGGFGSRERFTQAFAVGKEYTTATVSGAFHGSVVTGTVRSRSIFVSRRTHHRYRCDSGTIAFAAAR